MRPSQPQTREDAVGSDTSRAGRSGLRNLIAVLLIAVGLCAFMSQPPTLGADEGVFLTIGRAMGHGGLPYRDFWDHKTPGIYFATWVLTRLPLSLEGYRFVFRLGVLAGFWLLALALGIPRRQWALALMVAAGAVFSPLLAGGYILTEQGEGWAVIVALAAAAASYRARSHARRYALSACAGCASAAGIVFRPTAAISVLPIMLLTIFGQKDQSRTQQGLRCISFAIGFAVVGSAVYAYLAGHGIWSDMLAQAVRANAAISAKVTGSPIQETVGVFGQLISGLSYLLLLAGMCWSRPMRRHGRFAVACAAIAVLDYAVAFLPHKCYQHYLLPMVFALVPLAWLGLLDDNSRGPDRRGANIGLCLLIVLPLFSLYLPEALGSVKRAIKPVPQMIDGYALPEVQRLIKPGDAVWHAGSVRCDLYWYTDCRPATRYIYSAGGLAVLGVPDQEIATDLIKSRPSVVVVAPEWTNGSGALSSRIPPRIGEVLRSRYRPTLDRRGLGIVLTPISH